MTPASRASDRPLREGADLPDRAGEADDGDDRRRIAQRLDRQPRQPGPDAFVQGGHGR